MRELKLVLTILLAAAALCVLIIAVFWRALLTPEQKLRYGLTFAAAEGFARRARAHPDNARFLNDYADALAREGNLGRAAYLHGLYGAQCPTYAALKEVISHSLEAAGRGEVDVVTKDPAAQALKDEPVYQALKYLEGYRHALLGDWTSAKTLLSGIEERELAPPLRPYFRYYLARSYRKAGTPRERSRVVRLLNSVIKDSDDLGLRARAHYNLLAWYLSPDYPGGGGLDRAREQRVTLSLLPAGWPMQKAYTELGAVYLKLGKLRDAWNLAAQAVMLGPEDPPGKAAGELCLDVLTQAVPAAQGGQGSAPPSSSAALEYPPGLFTALARAGEKHGFAARVAAVLGKLPNPPSVELNEELRVALAVCYRANGNAKALLVLMADANLRGMSDSALARMYFEYAQLLEAQGRISEALGYYRSSGKLGGPAAWRGGGGEAYYRCYALLKRTQQPLDLTAAVALLKSVVDAQRTSESYPKAVEELLPILIYRGDRDAARKLAQYVVDNEAALAAGGSYGVEGAGQLAAVGRFWLTYLGGSLSDAAKVRGNADRFHCRYWSYYELAGGGDTQPGLAAFPLAVSLPETASEYFAGLGLGTTADDFYEGNGASDDPVLMYMSLANSAATKPLSSRQWEATELLESGRIHERALLEHVLAEAYPRPYAEDVRRAAGQYGVPAALIYAVMKKESSFKEDSTSPAGAQGLMQLMPGTVRWLISNYGAPPDSLARLREPSVNISLGAAYLRSLFAQVGQSDPLRAGDAQLRTVILSYNSGPGNYRAWAQRYSGADAALLTELIPNEENEEFGKKVWKYWRVYSMLQEP